MEPVRGSKNTIATKTKEGLKEVVVVDPKINPTFTQTQKEPDEAGTSNDAMEIDPKSNRASTKTPEGSKEAEVDKEVVETSWSPISVLGITTTPSGSKSQVAITLMPKLLACSTEQEERSLAEPVRGLENKTTAKEKEGLKEAVAAVHPNSITSSIQTLEVPYEDKATQTL